MPFTALHRLLGEAPGPVTNELIDAAIANRLAEAADLDWKQDLPPTKNLNETDFPKDVAAMANRGGGTIVFGVTEEEKHATGRKDTGELTENHEQALRRVAVTAISPPVFGLSIERVGEPNERAVVVVVPATVNGPHLLYRSDLFGAPIRNDADTVWMKESQIESMYRARFDARQDAHAALTSTFDEAARNWSVAGHATFVAIARPTLPYASPSRPTRESARDLISAATSIASLLAKNVGIHPLANIDRYNPRPGLRRWIAVNEATAEQTRWKSAWVATHHDGSVSLAASVGGHRTATGFLLPNQIEAIAVENAVANFMALVRAMSENREISEFDIRIGIQPATDEPIVILTVDNSGHTFAGSSMALVEYSPVTATVTADSSMDEFSGQVYELAEDCVNQGGITHLHSVIKQQSPDE